MLTQHMTMRNSPLQEHSEKRRTLEELLEDPSMPNSAVNTIISPETALKDLKPTFSHRRLGNLMGDNHPGAHMVRAEL